MNVKPRNTPEPAPVPGVRWIALTQGKFALVDEADYERVSGTRWYLSDSGYARNKSAVRSVWMHRLILGLPDMWTATTEVDHINRCRLDNRSANLRVATPSCNQANRAKTRDRFTSRFKGVSWDATNRKWRAKLGRGLDWRGRERTIELGRFADELSAASAYDDAAIAHFGTFAKTNFAMLVEQALASMPQPVTDSESPSEVGCHAAAWVVD